MGEVMVEEWGMFKEARREEMKTKVTRRVKPF